MPVNKFTSSNTVKKETIELYGKYKLEQSALTLNLTNKQHKYYYYIF